MCYPVTAGAGVAQDGLLPKEMPGMIEYKCHACGRFLKRPQSFAGRMVDCPTCLKPTRVPGTASARPTPSAPKPTGPDRLLCVDCGKGFPAGQMMTHNGQAVCTNCYHLRKPVVLKPRRKKSRKRRLLLMAGIIVIAAGTIWAVVRWAL
jgi:DNA-directed RNA polymerase subunit RPC12/RpoP